VDIVLSLNVATTPDHRFDAITTTPELAGWYTPHAKT
jgi:hypothetical protein